MVRILICEEEFLNRSRMQRLLAGLGECDLATSAAECVEHCDAAARAGEPYDLITLDLELRDLMASDAVEQIRAMKRRWKQRTKVLFTAAKDAAADDARVLGLADGRVPKPFESERLTQKLRELGLPL